MKRTAIAVVSSLFVILIAAGPASAEEPAAARQKSPLLAAGLNFFIPGAGYAYNGEKPLYVSLPLIAGAVGLTYLEQFHEFGDSGETLREHDSTAFALMFSTVFVINTALAIDAYQEARAINRGAAARRWSLDVGGTPRGGLRLGLSAVF